MMDRQPRSMLERLENRCYAYATSVKSEILSDGALHVTGTQDKDTITIVGNSSTVTVTAYTTVGTVKGTTSTATFATSAINGFVVDGRPGTDFLTIQNITSYPRGTSIESTVVNSSTAQSNKPTDPAPGVASDWAAKVETNRKLVSGTTNPATPSTRDRWFIGDSLTERWTRKVPRDANGNVVKNLDGTPIDAAGIDAWNANFASTSIDLGDQRRLHAPDPPADRAA